MTNIHEIDTGRNEIKARLRSILQKAEAGEFVSVAFASVNKDGNIATCYLNDGEIFKLIGAIEDVKYRIFQNEIQQD